MPGHVDNRIVRCSGELDWRLGAIGPVPRDKRGAGRHRSGLATTGAGHVVAAAYRLHGHCPREEDSSAEHEQSHALILCRGTLPPVLPVLVIFDCDGVLVDSERLSVELEARLLSELGWPMTAEELVLRWMGRTAAFQREEIADRLGASAAALFEERSSNEVRAAFETSLQAVPGVIAVLDYLESRGVKTCVASSGTHERIRLTLGLTNLAHRFEGRIFSAADVAVAKPAPDLFLHAADSLGVAPSQCAVVEDSVFGVQAGVAAGMTVYGFGGGLIDRTLLEQAGAIGFDQITDLVPWPTGSDS